MANKEKVSKLKLKKCNFYTNSLALTNTPLHRGAFCQFPFRWIYYYGSNKSTGKETDKTHLCALFPCFEILTTTLQCPSFPALHVVLGLQDRLNCVQCIDSSFFSALNLLQAIFLNCSFLNWQ